MANKKIKGLTVEIGGDTTKLGKALEDVEKKSRNLSSELGDINRLLKLDPGNTELLSQKQKILAEAVSNTAAKLDKLKQAEKQVQAQFKKGEVSEEQVRALQREIIATEKKMESYERATKETSDALQGFTDNTEEAEKSTHNLGEKVASIAKTGFTALAGAVTAAVGALVASAEATRDYREEMGKLEAAFISSKHSAETATETYKTLQGVIGETDQSVEAAQQIALLAESEKEAAKWAELAAGVVGKFGDALQPETFYEAANETAKLGEATGAYTQMLEGCGYNVEKFNEGLAACGTQSEKQAYMLEVTQKLLGEAGKVYKEVNGEVIRANEANEAWMSSMADVGAEIEPILSDVKLLGAALVKDLVPGVKEVAGAFRGMLNGDEGAAADLGAALSDIFTQLLNKVTEMAPAMAEMGVNLITSLITSIVGSVPQLLSTGAQVVTTLVQGLAQAVPQILAAGGQMLGKLTEGISTSLPSLAQKAIDIIGSLVQGLQQNLPLILAKGAELLAKLGEGISQSLPGLVNQALDVVMNFATTIYDNAPKLIDMGFELIGNLAQGILDSLPALLDKAPEIVSKFANVINHNMPKILKKGAELVLQLIKGIIKTIPELVKNIPKIIKAIVEVWTAFNWLNLGKKAITAIRDGIKAMVGSIKTAGQNIANTIIKIIQGLPSKLANLGRNAMTSLGNGIRSMLGTVKSGASSIFNGILNALLNLPSRLLSMGKSAATSLGNGIKSMASSIASRAGSVGSTIVSKFKELPGKLLSVGANLVTGLWNGVSNKLQWLKNKLKSFTNSVLKSIKNFFGVHSPSRETAWIGEMLDEGLAQGVEDNIGSPVKAMSKLSDTMLDEANNMNGLALERNINHNFATPAAAPAIDGGLLTKLDNILAAIERGQVIALDGKAIVGHTVNQMDSALGRRRALTVRGAI